MNPTLIFVHHLAAAQDRGRADPALLPSRLAAAAAAALPVAGVGVSLFSLSGIRVPVGADNDQAAAAERLQFTTGEGPCLAAAATGRPTVAGEPQLRDTWPQFHDSLVRQTPYRAVVAIPLTTSNTAVWGAVDFYFHHDTDLDQLPLDAATTIAAMMGTNLLNSLNAAGAFGPPWLDNPVATARQNTMMAVGMLNTALRITTEQALDLIRAHAYSTDTTVDDIADAIINNQLPPDTSRPESDT